MKFKVLFLLLMVSVSSWAGIRWIDVGVNGLTCSMCSRSVEMSISRLDFVDSVNMSLEKTEGRVYIKNEGPIDLRKIAKAITDAGFSVRFIRLQFDLKDIPISDNGTFTYLAQPYYWFDYKKESAKGMVALTLVDQSFLPHKEYTPWKKRIDQLQEVSGKKALHVVLE